MPREKFQTLTEQMFYILLCLHEECYGIDILDKVPEMTSNKVNIGSGTLYTLLYQFLKEGIISQTKVDGRKKHYKITKKGQKMLEREVLRLESQISDYKKYKKR